MEPRAEIVELTRRLLQAIAEKDWAAYQELCADDLTAIEPESLGQRVEGLEFHRFYFGLGGGIKAHLTSLCSPHVRLLGDTAVISYVRLTQGVDADGRPTTAGAAESRVWSRQSGRWKMVHFHRSVLP